MISKPTAAMEVLLNLTPLDVSIMVEVRMALYRLHILKQLSVPKTVTGLLTIWKNVGDPYYTCGQTTSASLSSHQKHHGHNTPEYWKNKDPVFSGDALIWFTTPEYWKNKDPVFPDDALIWFTDRSRADSETGSDIYGKRPETSFSFPLGKYATFFNPKCLQFFNVHVKI
jgi:hypothetical protein